MEADVLDAFETGAVLLSTLGFPVFDPVAGTPRSAVELLTYYCAGSDAKGMGRLVEDGFVVLKGSTARPESVPSAHKYIATKRQAMISSGVLVQDGPSLRFTEDYLCDSPSGASMLVLGRTSNGWDDWKTADGRSLDEVERSQVGASAAGVANATGAT